ncbi:MAG: aromatic ring-hydroxylating dioxygenase subunit alpha [Steroidobacteraceae bacterium]
MSWNQITLNQPWPEKFNQVPNEVFQRQDIYDEEVKRFFWGPEWHPLCHRAEIPNPGDYKAIDLGENTPVLFLHGEDGKIRAFLNVCPHRGVKLKMCNRGHTKDFECPYHRWTFSTTGKLLAAPGEANFPPSFKKENYGLHEIRMAEVSGLLFVTLSDKTPELGSYLTGVQQYIENALGDGRLKLLGSQKVRYQTNWKEWNDNEGYHAPLLHAAFRMMKWGGGKGFTIQTERHNALDAELTEADAADFLSDAELVKYFKEPSGRKLRSTVVPLFPLSTVVRHLNIINIRYAIPRGLHETDIHFTYFAHVDDDEDLVRHRIRQSSNLIGPSGLISLEDAAAFNRQHLGSASPWVVEFQRGVTDRPPGPGTFNQNDEAPNLVKWAYYKKVMGF